MKKRLQQSIPWLIAAVIFFFLFKKIPPMDVLKTMASANIPLFIFYSISYFVIVMLIDCLGLQWGFSRFVASVDLKETILMRGATYLLMLINYNLGQGGMAFYLKRTHQAPLFKTLGTIFYFTLIDLSIVLAMGVVVGSVKELAYRGIALQPIIIRSGFIFFTAFFLWILFWRLSNTVWGRSFEKIKMMNWILNRPLFYSFRESNFSDYATAFLWRLPTVFLVIFSFFLWSHAFKSPIPLQDIFIYGPIILVVGTLPLTPGGVGTVQALCVEFFKNNLHSPLIETHTFTAEQILFSSSLLWVIGNALCKITFGFYCLKQKSKHLFESV